jgi:HEAT repeat protein
MRSAAPASAIPFVVLALLLIPTLTPVPSLALEAGQYEAFDGAIEEALLNMGMTPGDMRIRHDYARPDKFRLGLVDSLMHNPASLLEQVDRLARRVEHSAVMFGLYPTLWKAMDVEPAAPPKRTEVPFLRDVAGRLSHLPGDARIHLERYVGNVGRMSALLERARGPVRDHTGFLEAEAPALVTPQAEYEGLGPFELHDLEEMESALADSVLCLSELIGLPELAGMCALSMKSAENLAVGLRLATVGIRDHERYRGRSVTFDGMECTVTGSIAYMGLTPYGPVVIGGHSDNTYTGCFALIADPGGNDRYSLHNHPDADFRLIIDYGGSDDYESSDDTGIAGIVFGTSILMDLAGDDTYRGGDMSLGSATYGGALLFDAGGDDIYEAGAFSQGAGFLGIGAVVDGGGNDTYVAGMQSQGFGYVMGAGLVLDRSGNDTYYTKMSQKDILRYEDHYLTLSQGCAFGARPDYSGGIGLLIDQRGNDLYYSDIFGQGVGYWFCVGGLIDRHGHDYYCSYQYAQGSGVHLAFGLLLDEQGNDFYQSKGVSQGCGHDLSLGLLADFSGNDCFTVTDLSQGAGNANGTGIVFDADGADSYSSKSKVNVNGYGNLRRDFGSIGLQLDLAGGDYYSARGRNDALWESGQYGLGMDVPGEARRPEGDILVDEMDLVEKPYTSEELFILASRGEPRFRQWREYAFDKMVDDTASTVEYLRTVLDTGVARERHTIKDILRGIGTASVPMLSEAVLEDNDLAKSEASWILGLIGDPDAFDALMELSRAPGWKQRSSALSALAILDDLGEAQKEALEARVKQVLDDTAEVFYVKKDAAYSTGRQGLTGVLPWLIDALESDHYSVRFASAEAMRNLSEEHGDEVYAALHDGIAGLSSLATANALFAAGDLSDSQKLAIVDQVLDGRKSGEIHVGVAVARLLTTVGEGRGRRRREDRLLAALPEGSWQARAVLEGK